MSNLVTAYACALALREALKGVPSTCIVHISTFGRLMIFLLHANALSVTTLPISGVAEALLYARFIGTASPPTKKYFPANVSNRSPFRFSSGRDPVLEANGSTAPRSRDCAEVFWPSNVPIFRYNCAQCEAVESLVSNYKDECAAQVSRAKDGHRDARQPGETTWSGADCVVHEVGPMLF